jgi:hypothetical protein
MTLHSLTQRWQAVTSIQHIHQEDKLTFTNQQPRSATGSAPTSTQHPQATTEEQIVSAFANWRSSAFQAQVTS